MQAHVQCSRPRRHLLWLVLAIALADEIAMVSILQLKDNARWRQRFRTSVLHYAYVAPANPSKGIVHASWDDPQSQVYAWEIPSGTVRQLTQKDGGISYGWLGPAGDFLYFLQDQKGSEIGHIARIPFEGGSPQDLTPNLSPYTLRGFDISRRGNRLAFDAVNENGYRFYCLDLHADGSWGAPQLIYETVQETWACHLSYDGGLLAIKSTGRAPGSRRYSILVFNTQSGHQIAELWDGFDASVEPVQFAPLPDDERLLATSTLHGFLRPLLWDPCTSERVDLPLPETSGAVVPLDWSADGARLLMQGAQQGLFVYDLTANSLSTLTQPAGTFRGRTGPFHTGTAGSFFGPDGTIWAQWSDATQPPQLLALTADETPRSVLPVPPCPVGQPWRSVNFPSSDGISVQAWLGLPAGANTADGPFPTILHVHGGPSGAVSNAFDASSQTWLDHGFAYLTVNYRGSTGFGRAFQEKINGDVGHWELEDMLAARHWLLQQGIADPQAILLEGGSYGGFLTIWALSQNPNLWAGGIAPVAIVDWTMNYEDSSAAMQGWARMIFGGSPQEKPELYRQCSPLTHAAAIQAPLLIFQGRYDSRATPRQMKVFEERMQELGKDCTVIWTDAGHGTASTVSAEHRQEAHLQFAYRVLGLPPSHDTGQLRPTN